MQLDEGERDERGGYNPNLASCVMKALEIAVLKNGRKVYHGPSETLSTYDAASDTTSVVHVNRDDGPPLRDPTVVNVGGAISLNDVHDLGVWGHDLGTVLQSLTEPVLREAAREAISNKLAEAVSFGQRIQEERGGGTAPFRGGEKTDPKPRGSWTDN